MAKERGSARPHVLTDHTDCQTTTLRLRSVVIAGAVDAIAPLLALLALHFLHELTSIGDILPFQRTAGRKVAVGLVVTRYLADAASCTTSPKHFAGIVVIEVQRLVVLVHQLHQLVQDCPGIVSATFLFNPIIQVCFSSLVLFTTLFEDEGSQEMRQCCVGLVQNDANEH